MEMADPQAMPEEEERGRVRALLAAHEELLAAARGFGATLQAEGREARDNPEALDELEEMAGRLDEAARAYGEARHAYGPCEWVVSDVLAAGEAEGIGEEISERSAALYAASEAV